MLAVLVAFAAVAALLVAFVIVIEVCIELASAFTQTRDAIKRAGLFSC